MPVVVRQFRPEEWALHKSVRLKALQSDPLVFGSNYAREAAYSDDEWKARINNPDAGVFGVFHGTELIGVTGVYIKADDRSEARLVADWLEKDWRGKGLAAKMYEARVNWVKMQPSVRRLTISYRESNVAAMKAGQKSGFVFTHALEHVWNDGLSEPQHFYELRL